MEEKQLDLNRPLLSIRRPTTQTSESEIKTRSFDSVRNINNNNKKIIHQSSPPVYKSDIKSGPVRNPGTVPFQWEHKPGKPKSEKKSNLVTHFVPKLPPGRLEFNANQQTKTVSENVQSDTYLEATDTLSSPNRFDHSTNQEEEEDGRNTSNIASGVCGLVPHICLRSSFGLLNPIPSVRLQSQKAVSVRRMRSKYQDSTTSDQKLNESVSQEPPLKPEEKEKLSKNFGELLASDDDKPWRPSSEAFIEEKTLYVDTIHSIDKKVQEEEESKKKQSQDVVKRDEDKVEEECCDQEIIIKEKKIDLESCKIHYHSSRHIVYAPPLPKAPSDSWLKRTLPTIPSKNNSFTWLQSLGTDNTSHQFTKSQVNTKWETIVKTSNTNQGFVCFSKEVLNPIPEA